MKIILKIIRITIVALAFFILGYHQGKLNTASTSSINEYYIRTEALLDSIYCQQPEYFDVLLDQDVYYFYECAKDHLNY